MRHSGVIQRFASSLEIHIIGEDFWSAGMCVEPLRYGRNYPKLSTFYVCFL